MKWVIKCPYHCFVQSDFRDRLTLCSVSQQMSNITLDFKIDVESTTILLYFKFGFTKTCFSSCIKKLVNSSAILNDICQVFHFSRWHITEGNALQWRQNGHDGVSNHQPRDCLLTVNSSADQRKPQSSAPLAFVRGIPGDLANYAENVFIRWRHHELFIWGL